MKVTIDTETDSIEKIKATIKQISEVIGIEFYTNEPEIAQAAEAEKSETPSIFNIFDDAPKDSPAEQTEETPVITETPQNAESKKNPVAMADSPVLDTPKSDKDSKEDISYHRDKDKKITIIDY